MFTHSIVIHTTYRIYKVHAETIAEFRDSESDFVKMNFLMASIYITVQYNMHT